jgi:phage N-6-adenine-methyltransferase
MEEVIKEITLNPEFKELIPPMSIEEYEGLEQNILEEGCRDALVLWNSTLIEGHNRYEICKKHDIEFKTVQKEFENINDVKIWILLNQLYRRNLNNVQRITVAEKLRECYEIQAKDNLKKGEGKGQKKGPSILTDLNEIETTDVDVTNIENENKPKLNEFDVDLNELSLEEKKIQKKKKDKKNKRGKSVRAKIAKAANVSETTVYKLKIIRKNKDDGFIDEETFKQMEAGVFSINEVYKELKEQLKTTKTPHVALNTGINEWYTPSNIIEAARSTMGNIDLDPASSKEANETVKATVFYTEETNGLDKPWSGNVWMNPPYAQPAMTDFAEKLIEELPNINQACVIVNNATETVWFTNLSAKAAAICLVVGRVKFVSPNKNKKSAPLQGQIILYFGNDVEKFAENFKIFGKCWTRMVIEEK